MACCKKVEWAYDLGIFEHAAKTVPPGYANLDEFHLDQLAILIGARVCRGPQKGALRWRIFIDIRYLSYFDMHDA